MNFILLHAPVVRSVMVALAYLDTMSRYFLGTDVISNAHMRDTMFVISWTQGSVFVI